MGLGAAGKIFGSVKAAKAAKANQSIVDQQLAEAKTDENKSFLDSAIAKDAVKAQTEAAVDARKNVAGRAAITGASDEAVVAGNTGISKAYADGLSRIAGAGTAYQERAKSRKNQVLGMQMGINQQKAESAANISDAAGELMSAGTMMAGMTSPKPGKVASLGSSASGGRNITMNDGQKTVNIE